MGPNRIYICNSFDNTRWKGRFINCLFVYYIIYVSNSFYFPIFNHWYGNRKIPLCMLWQEPVYSFICVSQSSLTDHGYWSGRWLKRFTWFDVVKAKKMLLPMSYFRIMATKQSKFFLSCLNLQLQDDWCIYRFWAILRKKCKPMSSADRNKIRSWIGEVFEW